MFSARQIIRLKAEHPDALVVAHPECEDRVLQLADYIGSTTALLNYTTSNAARAFIVVTEAGIIHQMKKASPGKLFIPAPPDNGCACNECPYMRLNTLEKVYLCMRDRQPVVSLPEDVRVRARVPLDRMLELSRG
jgi:quinolinate synthase